MQKKIFFILLLLVNLAYSQHRVQVLDSSSKEAISDVVIYSSTLQLSSDENGYFFLDQFIQNDSISFSHVAYKKIILIGAELEFVSTVELNKKDLSTEQIEVVSQIDDESSIISEKIELEKYEKSSFSSTAEILKSKTSLLIRDYGGEGSTKTASSRGMSSENTLVLFNEARVNDLRTGTFDFSLIDLLAIDKIEYVKNSSADIISAGGVLKINSENLRNQNSAVFGAMFNNNLTEKYYGSLNYSNNGFSIGTNYIRSYSPNEFKNKFEGEEYERENAQYSKTFLNGDIKWSNRRLVVKFYIHYSHLLNGLPGYVVSNNYSSSKATNLTNSLLSIGNLDYLISNTLNFTTTLSYHNQFLNMEDPQNQLLIDRNSQSSTFNDLSFSGKLNYNLDNLNVHLGYTISSSNVDSLTTYLGGIFNSNNGDRREQNIYSSINYLINSKYLEKLSVSAGINYQIINEDILDLYNHDYLSYKLGVSFTPLFAKSSEIILSYSNNYRHPTFNERYYSGFFGNNELEGEKYKSFNFGINYKSNILGKEIFGLTYFSIRGDNKIIWAPTILAIQIPRNISKVKSNGVELKFAQSLFQSIFNWELLYSYTNALNKSSQSESDKTYNKQIIYTPLHRINLGGTLNISDFRISANSSFVGKRYYTPDNTERNSLDPYFLLDLSASYIFNISNIENLLSLNFYNILDEEYYVIQSYPMPLKTISLNYQLRFK